MGSSAKKWWEGLYGLVHQSKALAGQLPPTHGLRM